MGSVFLTWGVAEVAEWTEGLHSPSISLSAVCDCHSPPRPVRAHWWVVFLLRIHDGHVLLPTNLLCMAHQIPRCSTVCGEVGAGKYYIVLWQNKNHRIYVWHAKEEFQDRVQARKWLKWLPLLGLGLHKNAECLLVLPSHNSYPLPLATATWFFSSGTIFLPPTIHVVLEWTCEPGLNQTYGVSPE